MIDGEAGYLPHTTVDRYDRAVPACWDTACLPCTQFDKIALENYDWIMEELKILIQNPEAK